MRSTVGERREHAEGTYYLDVMRLEDVPEVSRVEHRCFTNPWPESAYRRELRNPENNYYIVVRHRPREIERDRQALENRGRLSLLPLVRRQERTSNDPVVGFAGMWTLFDESHVTTIGVAPEYRGLGLGELLLHTLFQEALRRNAQWMTLEVRVSNTTAQGLYEKYGFTRQGVRRRYYSDNGEDADIMWSPSLHDDRYLAYLEELGEQLQRRMSEQGMIIDTRAL